MERIFEGVRILSLAEQYPGPFATMLLADLGADVVLVERPKGGDPARAFPPMFRALGRNKRSACLDLKHPEGAEQLLRLAEKADVLIEGFRPGTMDRLGVGYEAMKAINPKLIFVSISGFGQTGPYRNRAAHDLSYQGVAGMLFDKVDRDKFDLPPPLIAYGDLSSAMFAAFSIASALYGRERTGRGTSIDVSMTDGLVSWMTAYLSPAMSGQGFFENYDEPAYGVFTVQGGRRITLSIAWEDHFWSALCQLIGMQDVASLRQKERFEQSAALKQRISQALLLKPIEHWEALFDEHSIPWSAFNDLSQVLSDPHFIARGLFKTLTRPDGKKEGYVGQPVQFSAWTSDLRRTAPKLGEHTDEVFKEFDALASVSTPT